MVALAPTVGGIVYYQCIHLYHGGEIKFINQEDLKELGFKTFGRGSLFHVRKCIHDAFDKLQRFVPRIINSDRTFNCAVACGL